MKIQIEKLNVLQNSDEWKSLRNNYIGASEIGIILNIDDYKNPKELLLSKLGFYNEKKSNSMYIGSLFENHILNIFNYYEYDEETTLNNFRTNRKLREVHRCYDSYLLYIDDVPFIVSPDGYFIDDDGNTIPIETKFMNTFSAKLNGIGASIGKYAWQSILQQLVFNSNYGYIFTLIANTNLQLDKILLKDYKEKIDTLVNNTKEFYNILNECKINDYNIKEINEIYYPEYRICNLDNINDSAIEDITDNTKKIINGDETDASYASKYLLMIEKEKEIREFKNATKNYFILKYGKISTPIIADVYKIRLYDKFIVSIASPNDVKENK